MAVKASRTSSSLNGLMIAITIFMGPIPAWARARRDRAFSTEIHHAEKFTTRAQPASRESNAVPDPQSVIDRRHKSLAVADLAGARARGDDVHSLVGKIRRDSDFDSELRQKIHDIFGTAIDFSVALLAAVALDLGDGHAGDPDRGECLAHLVKFEWFDNGNNELHGQAFILRIFGSAGSRLDLRFMQVWHLSVQMAQKVAGPDRKTIAVVRPRSIASPCR